MKVLYNILNPYGLGADRWVYEGFKSAFTAAGHQVFPTTEVDDFRKSAEMVNPEILFLDFHALIDYCRKVREVPPGFFGEMKDRGTKIFCLTAVGIDREEDTQEDIAFFKRYLPFLDICFSPFPPETMKNFRVMYGKETQFVPHAADTSHYFPEESDSRFVCDIAFVGSFYTQKGPQFKTMLIPLLKKYNVKVYGSGWTWQSRFFRGLSGVGRRARLGWLVKFANARRMTISTDDERRLYASAKICINLHEYYRDGAMKGFSNEREFKTTASGGFLITDYLPGMERYFTLGREIVAVRSPEEWFAKIAYYLDPAHEAERKQIQEAGTARVLREHTYSNRVKQLLDLYYAAK